MADEDQPPGLSRRSRWAVARASWLTICCAILIAGLAVPGLMLATPGAYVGTMPHDSLSMVDIGYRMATGQIPGRDFHSAFGIIFQAQMGLAYQLGHTVAATLEWATVLFFVASAACAAYVARTRLSNLGAISLIAAVIMIGGAPFARADQNLAGATFAMLYNREGWALLLLLFLFWLTPRRPVTPWGDGLILGLLTASALYLKISYGGVALLFCMLLALLRPAARASLVIAAGVAALLACAHYGITNKIDPGPAVVGDGYAAAAKENVRLPSNWFAAVDLFEASEVLRDYLGERFVEMFVKVKRTEQARFFEVVTALDFDWYLRNA